VKRLTVADMKRANVPSRFWNVKLSEIPEHLEYRDKVRKYLEKMDEMLENGIGLFLYSDENSTGKTSIAVLALKQALRLRRTAYFEESGRLKAALIRAEEFEENIPIERRIRTVDLLVLDDVGKEYRTESGFAENTIESVLRDRSQSMRLTIMTSNLKPNKIEQVYSADLAALLRETMIPLRISGYDWRALKAEELRQML
jgi:DNA replication protein DnaC